MTCFTIEKALQSVPRTDRAAFLMHYVAYLHGPREPARLLIEANGFYVSPTDGRYLWLLSNPIGAFVPRALFYLIGHQDADERDLLETAVNSHIKKLRRRIKDAGLTIETKYNVGWRLLSDGSFTFPWPTDRDQRIAC